MRSGTQMAIQSIFCSVNATHIASLHQGRMFTSSANELWRGSNVPIPCAHLLHLLIYHLTLLLERGLWAREHFAPSLLNQPLFCPFMDLQESMSWSNTHYPSEMPHVPLTTGQNRQERGLQSATTSIISKPCLPLLFSFLFLIFFFQSFFFSFRKLARSPTRGDLMQDLMVSRHQTCKSKLPP